MGIISDIGIELTEPMERKNEFLATTDYWNSIENIAQLVQSSWYDIWYPIRNMGLALSDETAAIAIKLDHTLIDVRLEGILDPVYDALEGTLHLYGRFWDFVLNTLGFTYDSSNSSYDLIASGFVNRTKVRLSDLEAKADPFTRTELEKLDWLIDHYDDFNRLIQDDINYVITEVMGRIEPEIRSTVTRLVEPFEGRLEVVEETLSKTQFWFWDFIIDIWAFLAGGSIIPINQIEDAMITIGEWFIDEIYEITTPIKEDVDEVLFYMAEHVVNHVELVREQVDRAISQIDTLTAGQTSEVITMIDARISEVGGGVGPPGPPGPMGRIGPAGPAGPIGPPGEGNGADVNTINRELYNLLWNADAITTNTVTGVMDWMLLTYGERFGDLQEQITPITEFFTDETKTALTELVDKFGSPEAIVSFLIPESEGQEAEVLDLMQILISMTFERGY